MEIKLGFFPQRELHLPVLLPVLDACLEQGVSCWLIIAPFQASRGDIPEEGISTPKILELQNKYPCINYSIDSQFDFTITADFVLEYTERWGRQICLGHGTISKNIYFLNQEICWRESFHESLIVPGSAYQDSFEGSLLCNIAPIGFPKLDSFHKLIQQEIELKHNFLLKSPEATEKEVILVAPTHNQDINCIDFLIQNFASINSPNKYFILKPHGATLPEQFLKLQKLCAQHSNMSFWPSENINEAMVVSDLMISDLSSVCLEYYILNKPLLVYNHPNLKQSSIYNSKSIEFQFRNGAYEFQSIDMLKLILAEKLKSDPKFWQRERYRFQLFPNLDGKISQNIASYILDKFEKPRLPNVCISIALTENSTLNESQFSNLTDLLKKAYYPSRILASNSMIQSIKDRSSHRNLENTTLITMDTSTPLSDLFIQNNHQALLVWNPNETLAWGWDLLWEVSQFYHKKQGYIYGVSSENLAAYIGQDLRMDEDSKQRFLKYRGFPKFVDKRPLPHKKTFIYNGVNSRSLNTTWLGLYII